MKSERFLNDVNAAHFLGLQPQTLRNWRVGRIGPPYVKLGRSVRYRESDLIRWAGEKVINPEEGMAQKTG